LVTPSTPAEVFREIDVLTAEVGERLRALSEKRPAARVFARSLLRDHERQRADRETLRKRLGLPPAAPVRATAADPASLSALRASQQALVTAHVEGLPVLGDPPAVDRLAHHLVALARHLTVIDLWLESEESRG
jgi:hypothetical protein